MRSTGTDNGSHYRNTFMIVRKNEKYINIFYVDWCLETERHDGKTEQMWSATKWTSDHIALDDNDIIRSVLMGTNQPTVCYILYTYFSRIMNIKNRKKIQEEEPQK